MKKENVLQLKRHETFSIRNGWLEKALNLINDNNNIFSKKDATRILGIGYNMVKSLRYWIEATGIAVIENRRFPELTKFGEFLKSNDKYLDKIDSWWLIHIFLATNNKDAPVFYKFFNLKYSKFDKEYLFNIIKDEFIADGEIITSDSSLKSDIDILIKSYYNYDKSNPENNMSCPLANLKLLNYIGGKMYQKVQPNYSSLSYKIVFFGLIKCLETNNFDIAKEFNIEDILVMHNNPLNIFNISKSSFYMYLEDMKKNGLIYLTKTAGLNTARILKDFNYSILE